MKRLYKDSKHADECNKRWIKNRSRGAGDSDYKEEWFSEQCHNCAYYIRLEGAFIYDWGVCSNPNSPLDGTVRFEHDGCEKYDITDEWILFDFANGLFNKVRKGTLKSVFTRLSRYYKLGIITRSISTIEKHLARLGIQDSVSFITDLPESVINNSDPTKYNGILDKVECDANYAIMVSNRLDAAIKPAKARGFIDTFWVKQGIRRYTKPQNKSEEPTFTIKTIDELVQFLGG